jgi:hypothetical protein
MTPDNLRERRRGGALCLTCCRLTEGVRRASGPLRLNEPGELKARGPLDYDVPVTRRCERCGAVEEITLSQLHEQCGHCRRYPERAA